MSVMITTRYLSWACKDAGSSAMLAKRKSICFIRDFF